MPVLGTRPRHAILEQAVADPDAADAGRIPAPAAFRQLAAASATDMGSVQPRPGTTSA